MSAPNPLTDTLAAIVKSLSSSLFNGIDSTLTMLSGITIQQKMVLHKEEALLARLEYIVGKLELPTPSKYTASGEWNKSDGTIPPAYVEMSDKLSSALGEAAKYKRLLETMLNTIEDFLEAYDARPRSVDGLTRTATVLRNRTRGVRNLLLEGKLPDPEPESSDEGGCESCGQYHNNAGVGTPCGR